MFNFFKKKTPVEETPAYKLFMEMSDYSVLFEDGMVYFRENHRLTGTVYEETATGYEVDLDILNEWFYGEGKKKLTKEDVEMFRRCVESHVAAEGKTVVFTTPMQDSMARPWRGR